MKKKIMNLIGKIDTIKKGENNRIIAGYGNLAMVDSQKQFIPLETLKEGLRTLLADLSYANLMLSHQNIQVGKILPKWGKLTTHVDDKGLYIVAKVREDTEIANEMWNNILQGKMNGFSIGCELLTDPRKVCDVGGGNCIDYLDKINILEVSLCTSPVNILSGFTILTKSDSMSNDVCVSCGINKEEKIMTEEVKEEPKVEQKEEPKELSVEERIEAIERSLFNIQAAITKMGEAYKAEAEELAKKPEEKPEEEKKPDEEKKPADAPCKSEEKVEVETLTKKDFDEFKKSLEESISKSLASIVESLKPKEQDLKMKSEMELAIKARDEQIETLKKHVDELSAKQHINTVEKAEANSEPKTVQDKQMEKALDMEEDCPIVVTKGEVSFRKFVKS